jgi:elongation factor 1-alpha
VEESAKILTFVDVAGNEKYVKTMIRGICSHYPDYAMIVVDAQNKFTATTVDHFKLALAFNVPIIVVITKIDLVTFDELMFCHQ